MTAIRSLLLIPCALGLALLATRGTADEDALVKDPDWPCEQALVPQVAAAVVWDGPPVDGLDWRADAVIADLVARVTPSTATQAEAEAAVAAFADGLAPADKDHRLTLLFAGVLQVLNQERAAQLDGIKRYSQDQARRAEALGAELDRLVALERNPADSANQEREELKKRLTLEERVFDEREKSIQFLCTRPVAVEQRLGFLARTISGFLD